MTLLLKSDKELMTISSIGKECFRYSMKDIGHGDVFSTKSFQISQIISGEFIII